MQASAEQEEEYISNLLLKRISNLQSEKQDLLLKLEAEEEMITNQLQKKLNQLQREKVQMEISLEQEQEHMVNRLQKQLDDLRGLNSRSRKPSGEYKLNDRAPFEKRHSSASLIDIPPSSSVVEMLRAEVIRKLFSSIE